jgi:hypothetical protein
MEGEALSLDPQQVAGIEALWERLTGGARIDIVDALVHGPTALVDLEALDALLAAYELAVGPPAHADDPPAGPV